MFKKLFLCLGLLLCAGLAFTQQFPERPNTLVADYTNTLSASDKQSLENKLVAYNDSTSTQVAVVMIQSTGEYEINDYAARLLRQWGIGSKKKNNGVLVLVAMQDRKMAISTGYGAEGALPDITTQEIIQNDMKPHFKENDYYGGLNAATDNIIKAMRGEYKGNGKSSKDDGGSSAGIIIIIIIVIVILIIIFRKRGGGGGGRRIIGGRGGADPFWWFLAGNMLGNSGRSSGSDWGGFSGGGGGWGGGSSGGGGFGGFGGGSGGGGGSSGSW